MDGEGQKPKSREAKTQNRSPAELGTRINTWKSAGGVKSWGLEAAILSKGQALGNTVKV